MTKQDILPSGGQQPASEQAAAQLLASLLSGSGTIFPLQSAQAILKGCGGLNGLRTIGDHPELAGTLSHHQREMLTLIGELISRAADEPLAKLPIIRSSHDAARLLHDMRHLRREQVRTILLDSGGHVLDVVTVYTGTVNTSAVRAAEIFREAVVQESAALILAHNHPAGDPKPSPEDIEMTHTLAAAGRLLHIRLADHLIMARSGWVSLRELGLL